MLHCIQLYELTLPFHQTSSSLSLTVFLHCSCLLLLDEVLILAFTVFIAVFEYNDSLNSL